MPSMQAYEEFEEMEDLKKENERLKAKLIELQEFFNDRYHDTIDNVLHRWKITDGAKAV